MNKPWRPPAPRDEFSEPGGLDAHVRSFLDKYFESVPGSTADTQIFVQWRQRALLAAKTTGAPSRLDEEGIHLAQALDPWLCSVGQGALEFEADTTVAGATPAGRLRRARALRELAELHRLRAIVSASDDGQTQRQIAHALGCSQTEVFRALRLARTTPELLGPSTRELILQYAAGMVSEKTLEATIGVLTRGELADDTDGYVPSRWDEVRTAFLDGLIEERIYERLRARVS